MFQFSALVENNETHMCAVMENNGIYLDGNILTIFKLT